MRLLAVVATTLFLVGCFQSTALVKVNADGSGTLEHRTTMTGAAAAQLRQLAGMFGQAGDKPIDPFSEEDARVSATKMGEGVTLLSTTALKTLDAEGRANVYEFRDITKLRFDELLNGGGTMTPAGVRGSGNRGGIASANLTRTNQGNVLLTLHGPEPTLGRNLMPPGRPELGGGIGAISAPPQMAMIRQMLGGMRMTLQIEPSGQLVRTSSPYVEGQRVTLLDLNIDELLKDDAIFFRLQSAKTPDEMISLLKDVPGLKVTLTPEITIEFAPGK